MIIVKQCKIADKDHTDRLRQYAHTFHHAGNVICVAGAFIMLPFDHEMGLLAHELGHLLAGRVEHKESEADRLANMFFGIKIRYKDSIHGNNLQYLSTKDGNKVYGWFLDNANFDPRLFA